MQTEWPYPSEQQAELWWKYVIEDCGYDDAGWWIGRCPLHDKEATGTASALFNFTTGSVKCLREDAEPCTGFRYGKGRAMSFQNVLVEWVRGNS
jgi:hypothetical protein